MNKEIFYENDFMLITLETKNNAELIIFTSKKEEPQDNEWSDTMVAMRKYYEERLAENKYKYIMILNIENLSLFHMNKMKEVIAILKENKPTIKECCQFTTVVVKSSVVKKILNFGLTFYKNEKPVFFETNFEQVYSSIKQKMLNC